MRYVKLVYLPEDDVDPKIPSVNLTLEETAEDIQCKSCGKNLSEHTKVKDIFQFCHKHWL